jgi:hypothetical protein
MPIRAACPWERTHIGCPVWNAALMRLPAATPLLEWQARQNRSVLWHDWQSPLAENTSTACRSAKLGA